MRSLTRGALFLTEDKPFIICKAGSTKNQKDARLKAQYVAGSVGGANDARAQERIPRSVPPQPAPAVTGPENTI